MHRSGAGTTAANNAGHDVTAFADALEQACGASGQTRRVTSGACVFRAGDRVGHLFVVEEGRVRLVRHARDGGSVTLHVAQAPSGLAEASLFTSRYHCDAIVDEDAVLRVFPKASLAAALRNNPDFAVFLTAHLARQVQSLRGRIELLNEPAATERVLGYLRNCECDTDGNIAPAGSWKDSASEMGLRPEVVYRSLRALEREGRIERLSQRSVRLR